MKTIWLTGTQPTNFLAGGLHQFLYKKYHVISAGYETVDMFSHDEMASFVKAHNIDIILHVPDKVDDPLFEAGAFYRETRTFLNLTKVSEQVKKIVYFGSGAEYNKDRNLDMVREKDFGTVLPVDESALIKYTLTQLAANSPNMYNLRLFGLCGLQSQWDMNFISNLCCKAVFGLPLSIRRDCLFDFLFIDDLGTIVEWFLNNQPRHRVYNVCSGKPYRLQEYAQIVKNVSGLTQEIILLDNAPGWNYTGDNQLLRDEMQSDFKIAPIEDTICKIYNYYKQNQHLLDYSILVETR